MRALQICSLSTAVLCLAAGAASVASADDKKNSDLVDVSEYRKHMVVVHDGKGHYAIAAPVSGFYSNVFYGDGKTFYQQRTFGGGLDTGSKNFSQVFWSPRVDHRGSLIQKKGAWHMECGKRETPMTELPAPEAKKLLARAVFKRHPWKYQGYKLARDDRGTYYYVDRLRDVYGGKGFRIFVGQRGSMKRKQMTNIVSDSEGDIFATKDGELRFITSKSETIWVRGKRRTPLTDVPVVRNIQLIYSELGVYLGDLGTPCDHL